MIQNNLDLERERKIDFHIKLKNTQYRTWIARNNVAEACTSTATFKCIHSSMCMNLQKQNIMCVCACVGGNKNSIYTSVIYICIDKLSHNDTWITIDKSFVNHFYWFCGEKCHEEVNSKLTWHMVHIRTILYQTIDNYRRPNRYQINYAYCISPIFIRVCVCMWFKTCFCVMQSNKFTAHTTYHGTLQLLPFTAQNLRLYTTVSIGFFSCVLNYKYWKANRSAYRYSRFY